MRRVEVSGMVSKPNPAGAGRGVWVKEARGEALFHQFSLDYEEFDTGPGPFAVAVIEWPTGVVELVRADLIRFLEPARGAA